VIQRGEDVPFSLKSPDKFRISNSARQQFDGDVFFKAVIRATATVDHAHAAAAEEFLDFVAVGDTFAGFEDQVFVLGVGGNAGDHHAGAAPETDPPAPLNRVGHQDSEAATGTCYRNHLRMLMPR